jgi:hypothetical protein
MRTFGAREDDEDSWFVIVGVADITYLTIRHHQDIARRRGGREVVQLWFQLHLSLTSSCSGSHWDRSTGPVSENGGVYNVTSSKGKYNVPV